MLSLYLCVLDRTTDIATSKFPLATHQVYVSPDGEVWDAMLNQTNIGMNANKLVTPH